MLTGRGRGAAGVYVQELLVTELLFDGTFKELSEDAVNALAVCIDYEPRRDEAVRPWRLIDLSHAQEVAEELIRLERGVLNAQRVRFHNSVHALGRVCADDQSLQAKLTRCIKKMDRDVVEIRL